MAGSRIQDPGSRIQDPDPDPLIRGMDPRSGSVSTPICHGSGTLLARMAVHTHPLSLFLQTPRHELHRHLHPHPTKTSEKTLPIAPPCPSHLLSDQCCNWYRANWANGWAKSPINTVRDGFLS
jgi:hypothetical protein